MINLHMFCIFQITPHSHHGYVTHTPRRAEQWAHHAMEMETISAQVRPQSMTDVIVYGLLMQELIV